MEKLTREETTAAVKDLVLQYPVRVLKDIDPEITGQRFCILSFMMVKPQKLKDGNTIIGYIKCRGTAENEKEATQTATNIIRKVDSKNKNLIAKTGAWYPITNSLLVVDDVLDVTDKKEDRSIYDEVAKQKQAEAAQVKRELEERAQEAKASDIYDDPKSLRYYSMKRVTELKLADEIQAREKQLIEYRGTLTKVRRELKTLEVEHTDYRSKWVECYNQERRKTKLADFIYDKEEEETYAKALDSLD